MLSDLRTIAKDLSTIAVPVFIIGFLPLYTALTKNGWLFLLSVIPILLYIHYIDRTAYRRIFAMLTSSSSNRTDQSAP